MEIAGGNDQQKAGAIANMVQGILNMLSSISSNETTKANQVNKKNDKKIAKTVEKNFQELWNSIPDKWLYMTPKYKNQLKK